jgi:protein-tyrosine phosphatase
VSVPAEPKTMAEIIAAIDRAIAKDGVTYVHCWGGVGRTGLAVALLAAGARADTRRGVNRAGR